MKHFCIQEHFEDSKHYVPLNRCSLETNIKNQNKPFCFQGNLEDSKNCLVDNPNMQSNTDNI